MAVVIGSLGASLLAGPVSASPTPPPNPTDAQISAAQKAKNDTADTVGRLSALITQAKIELQHLQSAVELAEQKYSFAVQKLDQAQVAAVKAKQDVTNAESQVVTARKSLTTFVQQSYMSANVNMGPTSLLTATDPNQLLQAGDYTRYVADRHLGAKAALDRATVAKSNADAAARSAVVLQTKLTDEANRAKDAAVEALRQQQAQALILKQQQAHWQQELDAAQEKLATLNGQRAAYIAYQKEQARIAAERARQLALARARALAAAQARAAELARQQQLQQQQQNNGNGGNSGGGNGPVIGPVGNGNCHQSSPGDRAVCYAKMWLGMPYAWAGGNANGPTYGVNSPGTDGWNDSTVYGFDCSGLTLYAWANAAGLYMDHYAASQYYQAGHFHPSAGDFQPGDLLFWSSGGVSDIHHVALYIGGGDVIQAPNSGSFVQITPWDQVSSDYFGATRPLS